jgi:hypothetical protein
MKKVKKYLKFDIENFIARVLLLLKVIVSQDVYFSRALDIFLTFSP